jgi:hypothetical protein
VGNFLQMGWLQSGDVRFKEVEGAGGRGFGGIESIQLSTSSFQPLASSFALSIEAHSASTAWRAMASHDDIGQQKVGNSWRMGWW